MAADLVLPAPALERSGVVPVIYRTGQRATGTGTLSVQWTDVYGRVVEDRSIPVSFTDETEVTFPIDMRRAVGMRNTLTAHLSFRGKNRKGVDDVREEDARATFIAKPPYRQWWDYEIVMWQQYSAEAFAKLRRMGISGGQYVGKNTGTPEFLLANDLRWYAENISTDFYSEYHRWFPDRPVNWKYVAAKEEYKKDPSSLEPFKRHPSLSDHSWLKLIHDRLVDSAKRFSPYRPLFYSLGDESGIADLAAYWDFDFSDHSLAGMRDYLRQRYGTLAALNQEWGTSFTEWDSVMPLTTDQALKQPGENFAAWADFKDWMDEAYARALKMGNDAVRSVDPDAYVGIGGGQMPGWGGYDYYRISRALTAIEPYNIGNNVEILRSVNPSLAVVSVAFARGPWEKHRVWYELLHGNRGLLIWDDKNGFVTKSGEAGERGREVEGYYNELRNGIGTLLMNSVRSADPIAIHYSQASMRTEWMLARRQDKTPWVNRNSSTERKDSVFLRLRESWCRLLEDLGLQYNFVAYGQIEDGDLIRRGYRVLVLPHSTSLSAAEVREIRKFVEQGGTVIADAMPGTFNEHSRKLDASPLADLFTSGKARLVSEDVLDYHQNRLVGKEGPVLKAVGALVPVKPEIRVTGEDGSPVVGVETHLFENGGVRLIGLHSNPQLRVDELGPPEFRSNERFAVTRKLKVQLPGELEVYDVRGGRHLGRVSQLSVSLDPYEPVVYAVSGTKLPLLDVRVPAHLRRGDTAQIALSLNAWSPASTHVVHVEVTDASGKTLPQYSGNVLVHDGAAGKVLPLAHNDAAGEWRIRARDLLTGAQQEQTVTVE